jgi:hypothetical protein
MPFGRFDFLRNYLSNQGGGSPPPRIAPPPTARPMPGVRMPGANLGPVSSVLGSNVRGGYEGTGGGANLESARPRRNRRG